MADHSVAAGRPHRPGSSASASAQPAGPAHGLAAQGSQRAAALDALRGAALVWMIGYHAAFDLNWLKMIAPQSFQGDPRWLLQRTAILSTFLFCAGAGQALSFRRGQPWRRFWRRWWQVAACAAVVSAASALAFPRTWIHFGVLHAMALMLPLARWLAPAVARWPRGAAAAAIVFLVAWVRERPAGHPWFDSRATDWIGLVTRLPATEDYVPLLPWFGPMLLGLAVGMMVPGTGGTARRQSTPMRLLARLGQLPLRVYMLHQPLLLGVMMAWQAARR